MFVLIWDSRTKNKTSVIILLVTLLILNMSSKAHGEADINQTLSTLITASHISHHYGVLDAYGHISVRNPNDSSTFFLSHNLAPALIADSSDLVEYHVDNAEPVDPNASPGYSERCIHSEILKKFAHVNCVIHSHSPDVLPFCISDVPLKSTIHMAGFLGTEVPAFDIASYYQSGDKHDFLIRNTRLGQALASQFTKSQATYVKVGTSLVNRITGSHTEDPQDPDYAVVLMRGHGFTTAATSIEQAVYQAIYTQIAAKAQTVALSMQNAYSGSKLEGKVDDSGNITKGSIKPADELHFLKAQEVSDTLSMNTENAGRAWKLWVREVSVSSLYINELQKPK